MEHLGALGEYGDQWESLRTVEACEIAVASGRGVEGFWRRTELWSNMEISGRPR